MKFKVLEVGATLGEAAQPGCYLVASNWNDWWEYQTLYRLWIVSEEKAQHEIGAVKIAQRGMMPNAEYYVRPSLPSEFEELDETYFSLGQDDTYYDALNTFATTSREEILAALRDAALSEEIWDLTVDEHVMRRSLLRYIHQGTATGQFRRMAHGGARLTGFDFTYHSMRKDLSLKFSVVPESTPPTNIQVLIGRNGVGKTHLLRAMSRALLPTELQGGPSGSFVSEGGTAQLFVNLVVVSFSAFDLYDALPPLTGSTSFTYTYVGLQSQERDSESKNTAKSPSDLSKEFVTSLMKCRLEPIKSRWISAVEALQGDPIFQSTDASTIFEEDEQDASGQESEKEGRLEDRADRLYRKLSSGHRIVLLTITRLVETVSERSLVLIDEPEGHLHPPLLSAFVRALSQLLTDRNGVAIIATHSPVVLQEVPQSCVWKIRRSGYESAAEPPSIETFGENVGVLTREIFGLEVTQSGFHELLRKYTDQGYSYDRVLEIFGRQLGDEAKGIVQGLIAERDGAW